MQPLRVITIVLSVLLLLPGCAFRRITRSKNITYLPADTIRKIPAQQLNIYAPHRHNEAELKDVLVYIYGGNWTSGKRSLYNWFGSRLARKGVVAVVIDYPKSPLADYQVMAADAARSLDWVKAHIADYGGNAERIFVSGHSAGGHLAALITVDERYFKEAGIINPVKGLILIDAAGLDMYGYLKDRGLAEDPSKARTFSTDPKVWKDATPLYHLRPGVPPMLIFRGGRTYPSILKGNEKFVAALKELGASPVYHVLPRKKHIPMITQFFNTGNPGYGEILRFMQGVR